MENTLTKNQNFSTLLQKVRELGPLIRHDAAEAEKSRQLTETVVKALFDAGFFRLWTPTFYGGYELDTVSVMKIIEDISVFDSAVGWNLQIANSISPFLAWLPKKGTDEIYANGSDVIFAGALFPPGKATVVEGGYSLSGQWPFVSGCKFANWFMATSFIFEGDKMKVWEDGQPMQMLVFFPSNEAEILDTWYTLGMQGTGSHDIVAKEVFIPESRTGFIAPVQKYEKAYSGTLYRMTIWPSFSVLAPPSLGVAKAAINEIITLAKEKTPNYTTTLLRDRKDAQSQIASAKASLDAGRAFLHEALREGMEEAQKGNFLSMDQKLKIQLATTFAIQSAAKAVDKIHQIAGSSGIRNEFRFQKYFRDVHTMSQHAASSVSRYQSVGNVMFGNELDWPFFGL